MPSPISFWELFVDASQSEKIQDFVELFLAYFGYYRMIPGVTLDKHCVIVVNLHFSEIRNRLFSFGVNTMANRTVRLKQRFPSFELLNGRLPGFRRIVRRNIVFSLFTA